MAEIGSACTARSLLLMILSKTIDTFSHDMTLVSEKAGKNKTKKILIQFQFSAKASSDAACAFFTTGKNVCTYLQHVCLYLSFSQGSAQIIDSRQ
jgi:hypothetical protein